MANAIGAALGTVGGACDLVVNLGPIKQALRESEEEAVLGEGDKLEHRAREIAMERGREKARNEVTRKGEYCTFTVFVLSTNIVFLVFPQGVPLAVLTSTVRTSLMCSMS